jgi:hypothetical protein
MQNEKPGRTAADLTDKAREIGRDFKNQAIDLAGSATDTVKAQAENLSSSARELAADAGERMKAAMADQKTAGADFVGDFAQMVRRASREFDGGMPQAGQYIRKAAGQLDGVSDMLRSRDVSQLVGEVQNFARQQPTAFFGAAVLAGFAAVRFFKSAPDTSRSHASGTPQLGHSNAQSTSASASSGSASKEPGASARGPVAGM